jgi:anthranilate phosphoribosyltransferase
MNAGAGLVVAGKVTTLGDGVAKAAEAIDSGRALQVLDKLIKVSNG